MKTAKKIRHSSYSQGAENLHVLHVPGKIKRYVGHLEYYLSPVTARG